MPCEEIERAKEARKRGENYIAIVLLHMAGESAVKEEVEVSYFLEGIKELRERNIVETDLYEGLVDLNKLRNKVYHERYRPTDNEVELAFVALEKLLKKLG